MKDSNRRKAKGMNGGRVNEGQHGMVFHQQNEHGTD